MKMANVYGHALLESSLLKIKKRKHDGYEWFPTHL